MTVARGRKASFLQWIDSWSTEYIPGQVLWSGVVAGQQKFGLLEEVVPPPPEREHEVEWVGIGKGLGAVKEGR